MKMTNDAKNIVEVVLQRIPIQCAAEIPVELLEGNYELTMQRLIGKRDMMLMNMSSYILGMPKERIEVDKKWPATWWDAFKERWFPQWMLRRWPVEYERIYIDQQIFHAVCPHLNVKDKSTHVKWMYDISQGEPDAT